PLHSGYSFRTYAIVREQRRLGWETFHLTGPKQGCATPEETVEGLHFYRTPFQPGALGRVQILRELNLMRATARRLLEAADRLRLDGLPAPSPALNALPSLAVGARLKIPVVDEVRAFWEAAGGDH